MYFFLIYDPNVFWVMKDLKDVDQIYLGAIDINPIYKTTKL